MSADDLRHRATTAGGELGGHDPSGGPVAAGLDAVAARVPPEYRDAYLEGVARARATLEHVAA